MKAKLEILAFGGLLIAAGCGGDSSPTQTTAVMVSETSLALTATLTPGQAGGAAGIGGAGGAGPASPSTTLTITALDGATPVVTDLWLYTLEADAPTPLITFTSTGSRKSPRLMLPATIAGQPSGLSPADDGRANGLMTNANRGGLANGAFVSAVTGAVTVTLPAPPPSPILVVAGVEDQRYAGAVVVQPDGTPGVVPAGMGVPEPHVQRSFARDVAPLLQRRCVLCHTTAGPEDADLYLVTGTRDQLVNDNFALREQTEDCRTANPAGGQALTDCIQAINKAQFLVEPGAPAASDLLQRARPDEEGGSSAMGLSWFGGGNPKSRFNATYGDRRMPSTTISPAMTDWTNVPTAFDMNPAEFQILYDWVAQGALDD